MAQQVVSSGDRLQIVGDMTIYTAESLFKELWQALVSAPARGSVDLSGVTEIDTAGVQILLMARRCAKAAGSNLQFANPSPSVSDVLELLQIPVAGYAQDERRP